MTREETKAVMSILINGYKDKFKIDNQKAFDIWCECLKDFRYDVAQKAAVEYIKKSQYPPTVADIRNEYNALWTEYRTMVKHIAESYELATGCYPLITGEEREQGKKIYSQIVSKYPKEQRERIASEITQRVIGYVRKCEADDTEKIIPFLEFMERMEHEFTG